MLLGGSGGTTTVKTWKMAQEPPPLSTRFFGCMFIHSVTNQFGYMNKNIMNPWLSSLILRLLDATEKFRGGCIFLSCGVLIFACRRDFGFLFLVGTHTSEQRNLLIVIEIETVCMCYYKDIFLPLYPRYSAYSRKKQKTT